MDFLPIYISSSRGIATQQGVKIQQRAQNSTDKDGDNSTKKSIEYWPGSIFNGVQILYSPAMNC